MFKKILAHKKITLLVVAILGISGWYFFGRSPEATYTEYKVESRDLAESIELSGKVSAGSFANLRFQAGGLLTYLGAKKGDTVKKYQTIASVDTRQLQKILEQKLNLYASQLANFDDKKDSYKSELDAGEIDLTLRRILDRNQYALENAVKDVEYQDLAIKLSRLSTPIAGILVSAPFSVSGVNAGPTDTWLVVDPTSLEFVADIDESELKRVHEGHKAMISFDAFPDLEVETTIKSISYSPKETSSGTTYEAKMTLPSSAVEKLRLGLNGTAEIIIEEKQAVRALPTQAVTYKGGKIEVLVKNGNKYEPKNIEIGTETNSSIEVTSGLSVGDIVYVKQVK